MLISTLKGKSKKGKDRIRQHGDVWEVCEELDKVLFPTNSSGPFLKLRSVMCECNTCKKWGQDWRIISEKNDSDFEIVETRFVTEREEIK
jgi:hypothetical protein